MGHKSLINQAVIVLAHSAKHCAVNSADGSPISLALALSDYNLLHLVFGVLIIH